MMYTATTIKSILPELLILGLGLIVLVVDPFLKEDRRRNLGWLSSAGLLFVLVASLLYCRPDQPVSTLGGTIRFDWLGFFFKVLFIFGAAATSLLLMDHERVGRRGEGYVLILASTIGMCLMATAADLVMLYLAIETTSIPLYVLAGFMLRDDRSTEAGFKYLLFGAMTSAVMLYGFSLLYGFAGTTDLYALSAALLSPGVPAATLLGVILLVLVGLAFKVSIVPLHFWAPDVYEGSPTPVAGFLSTASKAAGFAAIVRVFLVAFPVLPDSRVDWTLLMAILHRQLAGLAAEEPEAPSRILLDFSRGLCAHRRGGCYETRHRERCLLHAGLHLDESRRVRRRDGCWKGDRLGRV
jgi:NADH-quinone oxidoreductase subunit N